MAARLTTAVLSGAARSARTAASPPDVDTRSSGVSTGTAEKEQQSHDDDGRRFKQPMCR